MENNLRKDVKPGMYSSNIFSGSSPARTADDSRSIREAEMVLMLFRWKEVVFGVGK